MNFTEWIENLLFLKRYGLFTRGDLAILIGQAFLIGAALVLAFLNLEPVSAVLGLCLSSWLLPYAGAWMHSFFIAEMQKKEDITFLPLDQFLDDKDWDGLDDGGEDIPF